MAKAAKGKRRPRRASTLERGYVQVRGRVLKAYLVMYHLIRNEQCYRCLATLRNFKLELRVVSILNPRTGHPILGKSRLGLLVKHKLEELLRTSKVACAQHVGRLEECRRRDLNKTLKLSS